jgi:hypothetical protein
MIKKLKLFKKLLALSKELKQIAKENDKTIQEFKHFLETAKVLYPKLGGLIEDIIELAKSNSDKKV